MYDYVLINDFIYNELIEDEDDCMIDEDDEDEEIVAMTNILQELERKEEHVVISRGSIKGRVTVPSDRIKGACDVYNDYLTPDRVFHAGFSGIAYG